MAQAGFTPISLYFSSTAAAVPTSGNLVDGEIALNTADMKLYAKNSAGTVTLLASNAGASGSVTSVSGTGTVNGLTLTGTVTTSGSLTLGGTLSLVSPPPIGSTTPNTGAFTTLSASSGLGVTGGISISQSGGFPTVGFTSNANGYLYALGGTSGLIVQVASTNILTVTTTGLIVTGTLNSTAGATFATSSGSVVIGGSTVRASSKLDVFGETIALGDNASFFGTIGYNAGAGLMSLAAETGGGVRLLSGTTERFRVASAGQIGLSGANYGTAGEVLTSGGPSAAPTWAAAGGGGTTNGKLYFYSSFN
jgi:hypothetical protein